MNSDFGEKTIPHVDLLFTYALLITGENRQAEKILSQTFTKAFWFWSHLSEETDVKIWMIRIMMKIIHDHPVYGESREIEIPQNKSIDLPSVDKTDSDREFDYQKAKYLSQLISSLPLILKEVIILVDVLKFSYELVADLVEVPEDVVRKRLYEARKEILAGWLQGKQEKLSIQDKQKNEIESQSIVENLIANNISIILVREAIKIKLVNKYAPQLIGEIKKESSPERRSIVRVATFAMIILITALILLFRPTQENPGELAAQQAGEDNILVQLKNNYLSFVDGKFISDLITGDKAAIKDYLLNSGLQYKSILPKFTGWSVKSLFLTSYKEQQLINLVYNNDFGNELYLYQIPLQLVEGGQIFKLTPELMDYLESNNCYSLREGTTFYLLKKTGCYILGFVLENPQKEEIIEICSKSYNSTL